MILLRIMSYAAWLALGISLAYLYSRVRGVDDVLEQRVLMAGALAAIVALLSLLAGSVSRRRRIGRERRLESQVHRGRAAMRRLVDDVGALRQGDLNVRASETDPASAATAELINRLVSEMRWLVGVVSESSGRVERTIAVSRQAVSHVVESGHAQSRDAHKASNYIGALSENLSELSLHAGESGRIANLAVAESEAGIDVLGQAGQRLGRVRDEAVLATRLMQRLAETATAIDERVETIRGVARRTDLLALNTTIRAAGKESGELSRLSDEVTQLAETLGDSARDIASLSRTIRQDADDTIKAMATTQRELETGAAECEQAGDALESIEAVTRELHELGRDIASKTLRQSTNVRQVSEHLASIHQVASDTLRGAQKRIAALDTLQDVGRELASSVGGYRLPSASRASGRRFASRTGGEPIPTPQDENDRSGRIIDHV